MDAYKNLPAPARIGIPIAMVLVIGLIAWMAMLRGAPEVSVLMTQDVGLYNTAKPVLDSESIAYHTKKKDEYYVITVAPEDTVKASSTLARSGIKDRTGMAKNIKCPAAPGFTATRAANERADNCAAAKAVQNMMLTAGAIAVNVAVSQEETGTLVGPEKSMNVVVQVFLPEQMKGKWKAEQAAKAISLSVGTTVDRVSITDDQLQTLFDGTASSSTGAEGTLTSLGCEDIASATEIETKKAAVRACYKGTISDELNELLGGSDRFVLTVEPTIQSSAVTVTSVTNTTGVVTEKQTQAGSGNSTEDVSSPPNTSETTRVSPAGAISSMRISVTIDKAAVKSENSDQVLAVKRVLSAYVDRKRGDPAPTVTVAALAGGTGDKATNAELKAIQNLDRTTPAAGAPAMTGGRPAGAGMPPWIMATMAALVIGMITVLLVMWRRSRAMAVERANLEQQFKQDQRLFENFAQQNPDQLARDLNSLFGAPSANEPTLR